MNLWKQALAQIELQTTKATFDTWLRGTTGQIEDDILTVTVANSFAKEWLENRLIVCIQRTVDELAGKPVDIQFAISNGNGAEPAETPPSPAPQSGPERLAVELVSFDPTQHGFVMTANYAVRFWQPYLRSLGASACPFALWVALKSFAYDAGKNIWPSIQTLADICGDGQRYKILGRAERKNCRRITGSMEVLEEQRIVYIIKSGHGRLTNYRFRVLENLPLLTPRQLERLSPRLQEAHKRWIKQCQLDYEEWEQLTFFSLIDK